MIIREHEFEMKVLDILDYLDNVDRFDYWNCYEIGDVLADYFSKTDISRIQDIFKSKFGEYRGGNFTGLIIPELKKIMQRFQKINERKLLESYEFPR